MLRLVTAALTLVGLLIFAVQHKLSSRFVAQCRWPARPSRIVRRCSDRFSTVGISRSCKIQTGRSAKSESRAKNCRRTLVASSMFISNSPPRCRAPYWQRLPQPLWGLRKPRRSLTCPMRIVIQCRRASPLSTVVALGTARPWKRHSAHTCKAAVRSYRAISAPVWQQRSGSPTSTPPPVTCSVAVTACRQCLLSRPWLHLANRLG